MRSIVTLFVIALILAAVQFVLPYHVEISIKTKPAFSISTHTDAQPAQIGFESVGTSYDPGRTETYNPGYVDQCGTIADLGTETWDVDMLFVHNKQYFANLVQNEIPDNPNGMFKITRKCVSMGEANSLPTKVRAGRTKLITVE